jgi:hypothetical protein
MNETPDEFLHVLLTVVPVAMYFLMLGLVNSQRRPYFVSGRRDFLILALVFCPVLILPLYWLAMSNWLVFAVVLALGAALFVLVLPKESTSWVIYNISRHHFHRVLERALRHLGLSWRWRHDRIEIDDTSLEIGFSGFALLRNVTVHLKCDRKDQPLVHRISSALEAELAHVKSRPATTGVVFLIIGAGLLIWPTFMMTQRLDALVKLFTKIWAG